MATLLKRVWQGDHTPGIPRRDRQGCGYEAYLPDPLAGRRVPLDGDVAADVADAERAIERLETKVSALADTEALARLLLRAESVASSHIEGLEIGGRRLLRAEAAKELGVAAPDVTADEVLGNIEAMRLAVRTMGDAHAVSVDGIRKVHQKLLERTRFSDQAGVVRTTQNWIGGSDYNPCSADFIPPPPEEVGRLLEDLAEFCNGDDLPAVAQAAIAHAQFETIHPFADGNGRTGRALIHVILRRRGMVERVYPPVSLVLATLTGDYIGGLTATRYVGDPDSEVATAGVNRWVATFAGACIRAVEDALAFEKKIAAIKARWRDRLGKVRAKSATDLLVGALPGAPIITVKGAAALVDRSFERTNEAFKRLEAAKIVRPVKVGRRRNRAYEVKDVIEAFTDLERQLASPARDTRTSPPSRPAPARPQT